MRALQKKRLKFISIAVGLVFLLFIFFPSPSTSKTTNLLSSSSKKLVKPLSVSVEEEVYADLAIRHYLNNVSVYSLDQNPNDTVSINTDKQWLPASTVKTYVAMYAYNQAYKGNLGLDDQVVVDAKNIVPTELVTDELPTLQEGQYVSIYRLIKQMVTQSDNTAYNVLLDVLDRRNINDYIRGLGLTHTSIGSKLNLDDNQLQYENSVPGYGINTTTAGDYLEAFKLMDEGKVPGSDSLLSIFYQQKINNMIPLFLPKSVKVAHKTGDLDPLYHDGGIITTPDRRYILTIFTNTGDPKIVAHISDLIYSKDLNLVGQEEKANKNLGETPPDQSLDPLVTSNQVNNQVLGTFTVPLPAITAADLGIKASDLTSSITPGTLPSVLIPADSRLHFVITSLQAMVRLISITPTMKRAANISEIKLKIAEAKDLKEKGKIAEANSLLESAQSQMTDTVKIKGLLSDTSSQTQLQTLSDARFSILSDEFKSKSAQDKTSLIKEIAVQAKETVKNIQPLIPQAGNVVSPAQNPLVGQIISSNNSSIKIRTAGGEELQIPNQQVRIKESSGTSATLSASTVKIESLSTLKTGSIVALLGASDGTTFTPSFVLKNIPKEVAAPQPVTIIKVDTKKNILVVSENGIPVQVNLTSKAVIKGKDTNVSLSSIRVGDVVVVHPDEKSASLPSAITPSLSPGVTSSSIPSASLTPQTSGPSNKTSGDSNSEVTAPNTKQTPSTVSVKPTVIQSSSVQVIEKKQDVKQPSVQNKGSAPASSVNKPSKPSSIEPAKRK